VKNPKLTSDDLTAAAWAAALDDLPKAVDTVPPGWLTSQEISAQTGTPITTLRRFLVPLVQSGRCEMKKFRVLRAKNVRSMPHYRLK
jgi:hypothetical protein